VGCSKVCHLSPVKRDCVVTQFTGWGVCAIGRTGFESRHEKTVTAVTSPFSHTMIRTQDVRKISIVAICLSARMANVSVSVPMKPEISNFTRVQFTHTNNVEIVSKNVNSKTGHRNEEMVRKVRTLRWRTLYIPPGKKVERRRIRVKQLTTPKNAFYTSS